MAIQQHPQPPQGQGQGQRQGRGQDTASFQRITTPVLSVVAVRCNTNTDRMLVVPAITLLKPQIPAVMLQPDLLFTYGELVSATLLVRSAVQDFVHLFGFHPTHIGLSSEREQQYWRECHCETYTRCVDTPQGNWVTMSIVSSPMIGPDEVRCIHVLYWQSGKVFAIPQARIDALTPTLTTIPTHR